MSLHNQTNITNFVVEIPDCNITKAFKLNAQSVLIPGIRMPVTDVPAGTKGLARASLPGSTVEFDPFVCRFVVDEELDSWLELYKWMISINSYLAYDGNGFEDGVLPKFITLHILDNSRTKIVLSIHFYGAWCADIGEVEYNTTESTDIPVTSIATFHYKYMEVEKNGKIIIKRQSIKEQALANGKGNTAAVHPSMR